MDCKVNFIEQLWFRSGIPIVKLEDRALAKSVGVFALPSIVIFRNFGDDAVIYAGDLKNEEAVLEWLIVQRDPSNEAIEEKEGQTLRKIIMKTESVGVFICKLFKGRQKNQLKQ